MKLRVCIAGITGWVGRPLAVAVAGSDDLALVAGVARRGRGEKLAGVVVSGTVEEALAIPGDVWVDYTSASAVKANVLAAVGAGRHVVVGSSGLSDADFEAIDDAARVRGVGVLAVGNFAMTAVLMERFALEAASHLPSWEIIEYAGDYKPDAPSGTARQLAYRLDQVGQPVVKVPIEATSGPKEARGATLNGTQVHSVRLPGHNIAVEVIFGQSNEKLTIRYESGGSAEPYIKGTLMAIRRVTGLKGVARGML